MFIFNEINLYIDGCSKGNPGEAGAGVLITTTNQDILIKKSYTLGIKTNNESEYMALLLGLADIEKYIKTTKINIYSDSLLLVNQINGKYKINNSRLKKLHEKALISLNDKTYTITHIPRDQNSIADELANIAIKNRRKNK